MRREEEKKDEEVLCWLRLEDDKKGGRGGERGEGGKGRRRVRKRGLVVMMIWRRGCRMWGGRRSLTGSGYGVDSSLAPLVKSTGELR